jgi:sugar-specific transcriptional regulator TrmB
MVTKSQLNEVKAVLKGLDLTEPEANTYLQCLQIGPSTVQEIAESLSLHRVTAHSVVERLLAKGFLFESRRQKRRIIIAEDPEVVHKVFHRKMFELTSLQLKLDRFAEHLRSAQKVQGTKPSVRFYEGAPGFKRMLEETLDARDEVLVFTYVELFSTLVDPDYLEGYFQRRSDKGIHTRLIFPPCRFADRVLQQAARFKIRVRLLPRELTWRSGIFSWNDSIAIKSFTEGKLTTTIIDNPDIAYFYRSIIYELCWAQAKRPESR